MIERVVLEWLLFVSNRSKLLRSRPSWAIFDLAVPLGGLIEESLVLSQAVTNRYCIML